MEIDPIIMNLKGRGESLLSQNLSENEEVLIKLQGDFGQALVVTSKRLYILKWGFQTKQTIGGKCIAYEFKNITGVEIKQHTLTNLVQILTPATQDNRNLSYWAGRDKSNNAVTSDSAITFSRNLRPVFQNAVNTIRDMISAVHSDNGHSQSSHSDLDELEKLASLKEKGIISDDEFQTKKRQILGLG